MTKLSEKENAMVSGGSGDNAVKPEPKYCEKCGKELSEKSDENLEEKYRGRFCSDCVFAIKIYSRPEF